MKFSGYFFIVTFFITINVFAQNTNALLKGTVLDKKGKPIKEEIIITLDGKFIGEVKIDGSYTIQIPPETTHTLSFVCSGYFTANYAITLESGVSKVLHVSLKRAVKETDMVVKREEKYRIQTMFKIETKDVKKIPSVSGDFNATLHSQPGVMSNNELSSGYSVRGGNFDENLVYVNDIEVYRPFLARSGEQEGLSFVNTDLVQNVNFSTGGFEARYGDKLSSVLDITYKKPTEFEGSASGSLMGGSVHLAGMSNNKSFTYLLGVRTKINSYVLNSLDTKGDYKPRFTDIQTFLTYDVSPKFELNFLGTYSNNKYQFIPQDRETKFGTMQEALRFMVYFDGQEIDEFNTMLSALSGIYHDNSKGLQLKFIGSLYQTSESETFDILGQYWLDELETNFGSDDLGDVAYNRGVGSFLRHARNDLHAYVYSFSHKGLKDCDNGLLHWGLKYQGEHFVDNMSEWVLIDSAGYSLPHVVDSVGYTTPKVQPEQQILMFENIKAHNSLFTSRATGYVQKSWNFETTDSIGFFLTAGLRGHYWDYNAQLVASPRVSLAINPNWQKDFVFRLATGFYYQPPFYKEFRGLDGNIVSDIKAQRSIHFVLASDYNFRAWNRPFKFITELFYKDLDNLIPYEIDNVRIRYHAHNFSHGYAGGVDFKINGEFVPGIDSWISMSIMQTMEDIENDFYYNNDSLKMQPGFIPRPTDQRVTFGLFFQDFLPKNPKYQMHLNLLFGSGLPFGPNGHEKYKDTLRLPSYRRVDIGFSVQLKDEKQILQKGNPFNFFNSVWLSFEVFNLLQISNTISYLWITDVNGFQSAVPNYLTARRLNLKLIATF